MRRQWVAVAWVVAANAGCIGAYGNGDSLAAQDAWLDAGDAGLTGVPNNEYDGGRDAPSESDGAGPDVAIPDGSLDSTPPPIEAGLDAVASADSTVPFDASEGGCTAACSGATPFCVSGACVPCSPGTTQCSAGGVQTCGADGQWGAPRACTGTNRCDQYTCQAGACVGMTAVTCQASDSCHQVGTCDPSTGVCSNPSQPDGYVCGAQNEVCSSGACVTCDAGAPCTPNATLPACQVAVVSCSPNVNACRVQNAADGTACAATVNGLCLGGQCLLPMGSACTDAAQCVPGGCLSGRCVGTADTAGMVSCLNAECSVSDGCSCLQCESAACPPECACSQPGSVGLGNIVCDGPGDCAPGSVCCLHLGLGSPSCSGNSGPNTYCSPGTSCPAPTAACVGMEDADLLLCDPASPTCPTGTCAWEAYTSIIGGELPSGFGVFTCQ